MLWSSNLVGRAPFEAKLSFGAQNSLGFSVSVVAKVSFKSKVL